MPIIHPASVQLPRLFQPSFLKTQASWNTSVFFQVLPLFVLLVGIYTIIVFGLSLLICPQDKSIQDQLLHFNYFSFCIWNVCYLFSLFYFTHTLYKKLYKIISKPFLLFLLLASLSIHSAACNVISSTIVMLIQLILFPAYVSQRR